MEKDQDIRNPRPSIRTLLMQNGDDLPVDCPECARLRAEMERLMCKFARANNKLKDISDMLTGGGLEVSGWHQNGDLELLDNWFGENDWGPEDDEAAQAGEGAR